MTLIANPPVLHPFMGRDAAHLLETRARQFGERPLLIWSPFSGEPRTWSYASFNAEVARLAGGLHARGIRKGDRVLVHFENCPETLLARFACWRIGAVAVLSNSHWMGPEIAPLQTSLGVRAAITQPKLFDRLSQHCPSLEWIAVTDTDAGEPPAQGRGASKSDRFTSLYGDPAPLGPADPTAPAAILFTTGTTSLPKAVLWTHANLLWGGKMGAAQQELRSDDVYQVHLPLFHVVGFTWSFFPAFWAGATTVLQPRFSASRFWPVALQHRSTSSSHAGTAEFLRGMEVPKHHFRQWQMAIHDSTRDAYFGLKSVSGWGMTEMVIPALCSDLSLDQPERTIGRPYPGYTVRIEHDNGEHVAPGESGQLLIGAVRGLHIFQEYVGNAKAMNEAFDERGFFRTGDLVTLHEEGWISFRDRIKDMIKVGGEGVSASEVEAAIKKVAGVADTAVVSRPDPHYGEAIVAFVVLAPEVVAKRDEMLRAINTTCQATLAKFKNPRIIEFVAEFPRIGNNKLNRVALRGIAKDLPLLERARYNL